MKNVRADILENLILKKIDELGNNKKELNRIKEDYFSRNQRSIESINQEIKVLRFDMKELNLKVDNAVSWIMENARDQKDSTGVLEEINKVKDRIKEIQERIYTREMELDQLKVGDIIFSQTEDYLKNFRFYYENKSRDEKRLLVKSVIDKVVVHSFKKIEIKATLPLFAREGSHLDVFARPQGAKYPNEL